MAPFQNDVFLSYSHVDIDWVPHVHQEFERHLKVRLGRAPRIWRDRKLSGADDFSEVIVRQLRDTAVLACVVSPGYAGSKWCRRELQEFIDFAEATAGLHAGDKLRVVKLIGLPPAAFDFPPIFEKTLGYQLFRTDRESGHERLLRGTKLADRLDEVAGEVARILHAVSGGSSNGKEGPQGRHVFVAKTTSDQRVAREHLCTELQDNRYVVLPASNLDGDAEEVTRAVEEDLGRSVLAAHIFGARYGAVPEGADESIVALQHRLASQCRAKRVLWIPPGLVVEEERQKAFLTDLRNQSAGAECDLVEQSFEQLTAVILDKLRERERPAPSARRGPARVYLICDQRDRTDIRPMRDCLLENRFEAILPLAGGDVSKVRQDHQESLQTCDGVLLYWGHADEFWLREKMRDLVRVRGLGRPTGFDIKPTIYVTSPTTPEKDDLATNEAEVIRHFGPFHPELLTPFMTGLQKLQGVGG